jgi:hypothetical protein
MSLCAEELNATFLGTLTDETSRGAFACASYGQGGVAALGRLINLTFWGWLRNQGAVMQDALLTAYLRHAFAYPNTERCLRVLQGRPLVVGYLIPFTAILWHLSRQSC